MKKEIRFSSSIDTKEFDRAIENMQRKLQQIYQGSDTSKMLLETRTMAARSGIGREPTQAEKGRSYQEDLRVRRELGRFIKDELKVQEDLVKKIEQQKKLIKELESAYKNLAASAEDVNSAKKEALTLEEKLRASIGATQDAIQRRQMPGYGGVGGWGGVFERGAGQYAAARAGGSGIAGAAGAGAKGLLAGAKALAAANPLLFAGGILAGGMAASTAARSLTDYYAETPARVLEASASAAQVRAAPMRDIYADRTAERFFFRKEEEEGRKRAAEEFETKRTRQGYTFLTNLFTSQEDRAFELARLAQAIDRPFGTNLGKASWDEYTKLMEAKQGQAAELYRKQLIEEDPKRKEAFLKAMEQANPNLQTQRALGLSDQELYGIYNQAGGMFSMEQQRSAMGRILGAGGSTRAARGLGTFSNQLMRDKDITNAPELMAALSMGTGSASSTENAMKKLLSESVKLGLDDSEFREEQRQFLTVSSEIIARTGARDEQSQGMLAERFSQFLAEKTMAGIAGARSAADLDRQLSGQTSGARGVMKAAALINDPALSALSEREMAAIMGMSNEQILAGNDMLSAAFETIKNSPGGKKYGGDIKKFQRDLVNKNVGATSPEAGYEKKRSELMEMAKGRNIEELTKDPDFMLKLGQFQIEMSSYVDNFERMTPQAQRSFAFSRLGLEAPPGAEGVPGVEGGPGAPSRAGDILEIMNAIGQSSIVQDLQDFSRQLKLTTDDVKNYVARETGRSRPEAQQMFNSLTNFGVGPSGLENSPPVPQQQPNVESK